MTGWPAYDFQPTTRDSLARNLKRIRANTEIIEQVRQETVKQHLNGAEKLEGESLNKFMTSYGEYLKKPSDVDILQIKKEDMNLIKNAFPIDVWSELLDIIVID